VRIVNQNLLGSLAEELNAYAVRDTRYTIAAATITTSKFGPSESLKRKNSTLENTMAVIPKMRSERFFDVKRILVIALSLTWDEAETLPLGD